MKAESATAGSWAKHTYAPAAGGSQIPGFLRAMTNQHIADPPAPSTGAAEMKRDELPSHR